MNNNLITGVLAGVSGVLSYIFGPWDAMIMVLIAVVALDYITGVAYAAVSKTLSSAIGFKGLLKKVFIFVLVALSTMLDKLVPATNGAVRSAVCMFYIANEGLSILEKRGPHRPAHAGGAEGCAGEAQGWEERYGRGQITG